ncbi:sulfatase [Halalkalicoccus tibetensis]|uniref:Sulfatase n=1 Tax=Halalkalicoccus tibetensis TaxID=175632 RepID=A0ABD5UX37_9EURY
MTNRPNVCLIHCHDLGQYLGCYGAAVDTPRIDRLASEGALFENHFTTAPQCSPSRASLMTGRHPHENGLMGLAHATWELHDDERYLPDYLSEAGYDTHLFGLQHVTEYPDRLGYDEIHSEGVLSPEASPAIHEVDRAREVSGTFADCVDDLDDDDPFFASIGFFELHRIKNDEGVHVFKDDRYESADPEEVDPLPYLPDAPGIRRDLADAQGMLRAIDDGVGTVLDALDEAGIAEDTLVIFTTEHGLAMPRAKGTVYDPGIEGVLLMRQPGSINPGRHSELISNVDVLPTLLELAGEPVPDRVSGRSFLPLLTGGEYDARERLFAEMTWHDVYNPMRAIRTRRYKYVRNFWHLPEVYLTNDVSHSPAGEEVRTEFDSPIRSYEELYDLEADPHEQENVVESADYEEEAADLREQLCGWMEDTDDPLLEGPVPPGDFEEIMAWPPE